MIKYANCAWCKPGSGYCQVCGRDGDAMSSMPREIEKGKRPGAPKKGK